MSPHRSASSVAGPSLDRDVAMGPPSGLSTTVLTKAKDGLATSEKYKTSKRRFFELDEKHTEASSETQRSGERDSKERNVADRNSESDSENQLLRNGQLGSPPNSLQTGPNLHPNAPSSAGAQLDAHEHHGDDVNGNQDHDTRDSRDRSRRGGPNGSHQDATPPNGPSFSANGASRPLPEHRTSPIADLYPRLSTQPPLQAQLPSSNRPCSPRHPPTLDGEPPTPPSRGGAEAEMADGNRSDRSSQPDKPRSTGSSRSQDRNDPDKEHHLDGKTLESSRSPSGTAPSRRSPRRSTRVAAATRESQGEPTHKTRGSLKRRHSPSPAVARKSRSESAALATAVAAAQAEAQAEVARVITQPASSARRDLPITLATTSLPTSPSSKSSTSFPIGQDVEMRNGTAQAVSDLNIDPALGSTGSDSHKEANSSSNQSTPMENIVKVAEAAIAAQKAANASKQLAGNSAVSSSPTPSTSSNTQSAAAASTSSTPYNPYMITTQMVPGKPTINTVPLPASPGASLSMNPYAMYYSPVNTPITPGAPSPYPYPYANPYFYLTGPMAGPSGMYPTSPNVATPTSAQRSSSSEAQRPTKPKRLKAHTVTSKSFSIPMVPRDKRGKPMLPLNVGIMTVINLGEVCMREHFHTERYIFPVGYEVSRRYLSTVNSNIEVVYHCTILDGGDGPKFQIVPSDVPDHPVIAGTATGAWSTIVKQANTIRSRQHSNSVSGPDFFGLGQNTIKHLIQELPNADRLKDYVWQTFIEGGPLGGRHAAVIPALPEEYDASMPVGAYYPTDRDKRRRSLADPPAQSPPKGLSHYPHHIIAQAEAQRVQQQVGSQPLQLGESSGQGQVKSVTAHPTTTTPVESGALKNATHLQPMDLADDRPHPSGTGGMNSRVLQSGDNSTTGDESAVPATFASIMNAYSTAGGASNTQPPE